MKPRIKIILAGVIGFAAGIVAIQFGLPIVKYFGPPKVTLMNTTGDSISDVTISLGTASRQITKVIKDGQTITVPIEGKFGESSTLVSWTDSAGKHSERAGDYIESNGGYHSKVVLTPERKAKAVYDVTEMSKTIEMLSRWDWAAIIQSASSVFVAFIAWLALSTWKQQSKAQKKSEFMDELTDTVHEFISLLGAPTQMVKYIKMAIECHEQVSSIDPRIKNSGVIEYIKKDGKQESKRLRESLEPCEHSLIKINSLIAKGQVFGFSDYNSCQESCKMITWQYDRIQALGYMIGNESANWENPEVKETLDKVVALEESDIREVIAEFNSKFLTFVKKNYEIIYK